MFVIVMPRIIFSGKVGVYSAPCGTPLKAQVIIVPAMEQRILDTNAAKQLS
jgi:hypothetical protein